MVLPVEDNGLTQVQRNLIAKTTAANNKANHDNEVYYSTTARRLQEASKAANNNTANMNHMMFPSVGNEPREYHNRDIDTSITDIFKNGDVKKIQCSPNIINVSGLHQDCIQMFKNAPPKSGI